MSASPAALIVPYGWLAGVVVSSHAAWCVFDWCVACAGTRRWGEL